MKGLTWGGVFGLDWEVMGVKSLIPVDWVQYILILV